MPQVRVARGALADLAYHLNRALLYSLMLAYVPLMLATAGGLAYAAFRLTLWVLGLSSVWRAAGFYAAVFVGMFDLAVVTAVGLLVFGLLPLFFRTVTPKPYGERLDPQRHPNLHSIVVRLCRRLRTRIPDTYLLTPFEHTGIGDLRIMDPDRGLQPKVRTLMLGAGHVVHTRADEFVTILCHEMAHSATGDTWMSRLSYRLHASLTSQVSLQDNRFSHQRGWLRFILTLLLMGYYRLFAWLYCIDARYRELRADRIAAEVCGPQNVRNALIKTHLVAFLPELSIERLWSDYCVHERDVANLYAEHRRRWDSLPDARRGAAENEMFMARATTWSSHPALADRIRNLQGVAAKELKMDHPATSLFHHWEALEHQTTSRLIKFGRTAFAAYLDELDRGLQVAR